MRGALLAAALAAASCVTRLPVVSGALPSEAGALAYEASGDGPAVVFLNGGGMDRRQWDAQFFHLGPRFRVVRYDPRGWGASPAPTSSYSMSEDLRALLAHLGIPRATLVGSSIGGAVAIDFALQHPDGVEGLVLLAPALGGFRWSDDYAQRVRRFLSLAREAAPEELAAALLDDPHLLPGAKRDKALERRARPLLAENAGRVLNLDISLIRPVDPPAIGRLGEIRAPTVVVLPELDHPDVRRIAEVLETQVRGARLIPVAGSGHIVHLEKPEEVDRILDEFLRDLESRRPR